MDIISRLPECAGQAADAVSVHTQVKMEDASTLLRIPKSECPDFEILLQLANKTSEQLYKVATPCFASGNFIA